MVRLLQDLHVQWAGEIYVTHKQMHGSSSSQLKQHVCVCVSVCPTRHMHKQQQSRTSNESY